MSPALLLALTLASPSPDTTVRLPRNGSVEIESRLSDITVSVGAGDVVTVHGGRAYLDGGTLHIDDNARRNGGGRGIAIVVTVPRSARVDASSIAGAMTFNGTPESVHAASVSGLVRVTSGSGSVEVESVAGGVTVTDFHGDRLSIDATGGNVEVTNASGAIEVENVNADVTLRGIHSDKVSAASINGSVSFDGPLASTGNYEFSSQNKDVTLVLSADVSARVEVSTANGQLNSQIPARTTGMDERPATRTRDTRGKGKRSHDASEGEQTFTAVYGGGAARVTVDVYNGNLVVRRATARP